jgi:hypothetical protein
MAHFFPHDRFNEFKHASERNVAEALKRTLPADVRVYHGYLYLEQVRNYAGPGTHLSEGEIDFVILDPDCGFLVVEVKGGPVEYDPETGNWYYDRNGRREPLRRNPVEQARENMHALANRMLEGSFQGLPSVPCTYGYALVFPDHNPVGIPPPGTDHSILLGWRDMPELGTKLLAALRRWRASGVAVPLPALTWRRLCEGVTGGFRLIEVLSRRLEAQEEILERLTKEQERSLAGLYVNPRVLVKGVAGSGKTMLAMARARRYALQDKLTLFLCFNSRLADHLRSLVAPELRDKLHVFTFNALCSRYCDEGRPRIKYQVPPEEDREGRRLFFEVTAPNLLDHAINRVPRRYDAIVVDKGQDFRPNWWTPIEMLNAHQENGPLYVFYDPDQNIYLDESPFVPDLPVCYELQANCRNTREIGALCGTVLGKELLLREDAAPGTRPEEVVVPSSSARRDRCLHQVRHWLGPDGLQPRQVAILSPWT